MDSSPKKRRVDDATVSIGSRASPLAMWQTNYVVGLLEKAGVKDTFCIRNEKTYGDKVLDRSLVDIGTTNPGLFTKELEIGLLNKSTRFVVHSLKDMPTELPAGLILACITERSTVEDCVVLHPSNKRIVSLQDLPAGSIVGTSSMRREALLKFHYPHLVARTIRGNVQTRLGKLDADDSEYACILMAKVGLERCALDDRIGFTLDWPYCVSQGALGIETREDDDYIRAMLEKINHAPTAYRCLAERSLLNALEGGCQIAMGVRSSLANDQLKLYAIVLAADGKDSLERTIERECRSQKDAVAIGRLLANEMREEGAERIVGRPGSKRAITYGNAESPQGRATKT